MDEDYRQEMQANRTWKRLAILKRATLISYAHTVLTRECFEMVKHDSKYEVIDYLTELGFADDCISQFAVR